MPEDREKHAVNKYDERITVKPKQMEALCHVLNGHDVLVSLPVGYGKSLIFFDHVIENGNDGHVIENGNDGHVILGLFFKR